MKPSTHSDTTEMTETAIQYNHYAKQILGGMTDRPSIGIEVDFEEIDHEKHIFTKRDNQNNNNNNNASSKNNNLNVPPSNNLTQNKNKNENKNGNENGNSNENSNGNGNRNTVIIHGNEMESEDNINNNLQNSKYKQGSMKYRIHVPKGSEDRLETDDILLSPMEKDDNEIENHTLNYNNLNIHMNDLNDENNDNNNDSNDNNNDKNKNKNNTKHGKTTSSIITHAPGDSLFQQQVILEDILDDVFDDTDIDIENTHKSQVFIDDAYASFVSKKNHTFLFVFFFGCKKFVKYGTYFGTHSLLCACILNVGNTICRFLESNCHNILVLSE